MALRDLRGIFSAAAHTQRAADWAAAPGFPRGQLPGRRAGAMNPPDTIMIDGRTYSWLWLCEIRRRQLDGLESPMLIFLLSRARTRVRIKKSQREATSTPPLIRRVFTSTLDGLPRSPNQGAKWRQSLSFLSSRYPSTHSKCRESKKRR